MSRLREQLAALSHGRWSGWMKYLFSKCSEPNQRGDLLIPAQWADRWTRQAFSNYDELSEAEKESDRDEADQVLALLAAEPEVSAPLPTQTPEPPTPSECCCHKHGGFSYYCIQCPRHGHGPEPFAGLPEHHQPSNLPARSRETFEPPTVLNMLREVEVFLRELDGNQSGTIRDLADKCKAVIAALPAQTPEPFAGVPEHLQPSNLPAGSRETAMTSSCRVTAQNPGGSCQ